MKIKDININESTTSGSVATVASPLGKTQSRNASIYGDKKGGNLLTGKKTNKKYANSVTESKADRERNRLMQIATDYEERAKKTKDPIKKDHYRKMADDARSKIVGKGHVSESKMKELASDIRDMDNGNFQKKYKKSKEQMKYALGDPDKKPVSEAHLEEDDLILVPGQGHRLKTGFHAFDPDKAEHEGETLKNSLRTIARNAKELHSRLENHDQFPEWVSEKIGQIKGMITSVTEYLISHQEGDAAPEHEGVIAGGGVGESLANWNMGVQSIPRTSEWKRKAITAVMPGAMGKEYTFDTEQEAIQHFGKDAWEKIKAGVPTKSGKPWEVIYADDVTEGKGLWANIHTKRERIKHGSGEHMRKLGSKGAPSAQDFKDAAKEGVGEKIKGVIRREKAKDLPLIQTCRDYASMQAGDAYEKGQTRKGNQYMAWAERDRKKKGDRTTNPAGTYRTKTSDYTNEGEDKQGDEYKAWRKKNFNDKKTTDKIVKGSDTRTKYDLDEAQSMGAALKNTLAKAEPGSKLDNSIKSHNRHIKAGLPGTLKNAPTGYHFDSKGYCRLGDK